jgi:hypothetical protein
VFTAPPVAVSALPGPILPEDDWNNARGGWQSVKVYEAGGRWGNMTATADIFDLVRDRNHDEGTYDRELQLL